MYHFENVNPIAKRLQSVAIIIGIIKHWQNRDRKLHCEQNKEEADFASASSSKGGATIGYTSIG
ncbi:hypothetical protein SAMD00020551_3342 [Mesobacillus selenatarsenatis SF-1]|uniref:Uncharacterized protein n=1 Tax=Mesobacillus selenatarsenatis (strain DSM 18680 / JCM 14380 / FERM P-15431 / SF-1) TaxID=1321606 RepID=A0A0A8XAH2_MESS1|nr:hypothetical protein SAMD00020551_3342 [Mesobacillus selenatarsenatis SF-1]